MPRWNSNKKKKGNKKSGGIISFVVAHCTATVATTTTPYSRNNKQRNASDRTTIISIVTIFVLLALLYQAVGIFQFTRFQKQLLQPTQDQPLLLYFNNDNKDYNKVDDSDKKENEKEIESEANFSTTEKQKRLSPELVKRSTTTTNNDKLITAFDDHGINQQQNGFIVIEDDDDASSVLVTKLRNDLELCFSPLINNDVVTIKRWLKGRQDHHQHFLCHLEGIGSFQIIECLRKNIYFIESRDEEDYGTQYFMKLKPPLSHSVSREEMEIIYYLSTIHKGNVNKLTAKPHPRYPYLEWKRTKSRTATFNKVAVIVEERLNFMSLGNFHDKLHTIDQIMSPSNQKQMVQCWKDVLTVIEALWNYQDGYYIHSDIHDGQILMVPITKRGDNNHNNANNDADDMDGIQYRCHVIDFGMVRSLTQGKQLNRKISHMGQNRNLFWYTQLSNKLGSEEFYQRGWEFSVTQWGHTLFLKQFLKILFGDNRHVSFFNNVNINNRKFYAGRCRASTMIQKLVQTLEQYQQQRPDLDDALFRLVLEQSTIINRGVSFLNCTKYKALLT